LIHVSDDAHEFIRILVEKLCEDMKDETQCRSNVVAKATDEELENMQTLEKSIYYSREHLSSNSSIITDEFCGQLISTTQCSVCNEVYTKFEPFYDISLPVPEGNTDLQTLDDCIREYTKVEQLDVDNMFECKKCCCKCVGTKRLQVSILPNVLVLHLKRFEATQTTNDDGTITFGMKKVQTKVKFPTIDYNASSIAYDSNTLPSQPMYNLFAVCNHVGETMSCGHYTATCIDPHTNSWYSFDDKDVQKLSEPNFNYSEAYMLFYVKNEREGNVVANVDDYFMTDGGDKILNNKEEEEDSDDKESDDDVDDDEGDDKDNVGSKNSTNSKVSRSVCIAKFVWEEEHFVFSN
jgi:ubiquitin carboxyl-terminal hydrolase 2/21